MEPKRKVKVDLPPFFASLGAFFFASWGILISLLTLQSRTVTSIWWIGASLSFALALIITFLCFFEIKSKRDSLIAFSLDKEKLEQKQSQELALEKQQRLQDQRHFEVQTKELTAHFLTQIQKQQEAKDQEIQELKKAYEALFASEQFAKNQTNSLKISLEAALEEARQSNMKYYLFKEASQQKPVEKEPAPAQEIDKNLRYQLEEKTQQLNQSRKQLFELEGEYLLLQKQLVESPQEETSLVESLRWLSTQIKDLEEENKLLENIVSSLSVSKRSSRAKKSPKIEEPSEPVQLTF